MMAKQSQDDSSDLGADFAELNLDEQEERALKEIEDLEKEERVANLLERRDRLLLAREKRRSGATKAKEEAAPARQTADHDARREPEEAAAPEPRSRHRSRGRARRRSTSDSRSRSSSSARRRKSKWSIRKHTMGSKNVKQLNAYELIGAFVRWFIDVEEKKMEDVTWFLEHIDFLTVRAMHNDFKDSAHVVYDQAVRKRAESQGFAAFSAMNSGISVKHYGAQHMRAYGTSQHGRTTFKKTISPYLQDGKRGCFKWNKDSGCPRSDEQCGFGHWCSKCGSKNHKRYTCTKE